MTSSTDERFDTSRRSYKRSRTTITGDSISTETEQIETEYAHNHNFSAVASNNSNDAMDIQIFVDDSDDDDDMMTSMRHLYLMNIRLIDLFLYYILHICMAL